MQDKLKSYRLYSDDDDCDFPNPDSMVPSLTEYGAEAEACEERELAEWAVNQDLIELAIYYPGGSVRVCGRVLKIGAKSPFLDIGGNASVPLDAIVYKSTGPGWVFNSRSYWEANDVRGFASTDRRA